MKIESWKIEALILTLALVGSVVLVGKTLASLPSQAEIQQVVKGIVK